MDKSKLLCTKKASRRVHYIGRYEHLIQLVMLKLVGVMDKRQAVLCNL